MTKLNELLKIEFERGETGKEPKFCTPPIQERFHYDAKLRADECNRHFQTRITLVGQGNQIVALIICSLQSNNFDGIVVQNVQ